jgi:hypothetical protein
MKTTMLFLLAITLAAYCHGTDLIEKCWFPNVDGFAVKGEYIDLNTNETERLYIRYYSGTDNGVELERTTNNVVLWRAHVQPIIPPSEQLHSKYCHEVTVFVNSPNEIIVISAAGLDLGKESGVIYANSKDAKEVYEVHSFKTGELISRKVTDLKPQSSP